jgi:hypothetical protein
MYIWDMLAQPVQGLYPPLSLGGDLCCSPCASWSATAAPSVFVRSAISEILYPLVCSFYHSSASAAYFGAQNIDQSLT